jgi:plasmid stabilization system protein ParE
MEQIERRLLIANEAQKQLRNAYEYILKDSVQQAEGFLVEIMNSFKTLVKFPEKYPVDKYKKDNDGSFRAYEMYRYRITYQLNSDTIIIVRIRHTKMNPVQF